VKGRSFRQSHADIASGSTGQIEERSLAGYLVVIMARGVHSAVKLGYQDKGTCEIPQSADRPGTLAELRLHGGLEA
jgi:hypothetical protein